MVLTSLNSWLGIWIILKLSVFHCDCFLTYNHSLLFCHYLPISWLIHQGLDWPIDREKIQEKGWKSELLLIWLQHRVSLVSSINIIASALSMGDMLHRLIPKSSVCILMTCSHWNWGKSPKLQLFVNFLQQFVSDPCYLWQQLG